MKHRIPFIAAVALGLAALAGCETNALYDGPGLSDRVVVQGTFAPGLPWQIRLTEAVSLRDTLKEYEPSSVNGAEVLIEGNDGTREMLRPTGRGRYNAAQTPAPGVQYTLRITHPTRGKVEAESGAPLAPAIHVNRLVRIRDSSVGDDPTTIYEADLEVRASAPGYVMLETLQVVPSWEANGTYILRGTYLSGDHRVMRGSFADTGTDPQYWGRHGRLFFMRPFTSGETRSVTVTIQASRRQGARRELTVRASTLSDDLQRHMASLDLQDVHGNDPFAEPVRIYSNVRGGHGIFAGYGRHEVKVPLP